MYEKDLQEKHEPAIWFRRFTSSMTSLTKLGGLPNLPSDVEWPRQSQSGTPLHFLAQIDLSQLPATPLAARLATLPNLGFLYFFADIVEEMLWNENGGPHSTTRVVYEDKAGSERSPPDDIPEILHAFGKKDGGYETGICVYPQVFFGPYVIDTFGGVSPFDFDAYTEAAQVAMVASIEKAIGAQIPIFSRSQAWNEIEAAKPREYIKEYSAKGGKLRRELNCPLHQMLGFGKNVQGASEDARLQGDTLLFQIDSDRSVHRHFMFCDMGVAQFWIKPDDLAAKRFVNAWATTERG